MIPARAAPRASDVPQSFAAERALIGAVLLDEDEVWGELWEEPIDADVFFAPEHRAIWRAYQWCYGHGMRITWQSTCHALSEMGWIEKVDELLVSIPVEEYLVILQHEAYAATGCLAWARMLRQYAERRNPVRLVRREMAL